MPSYTQIPTEIPHSPPVYESPVVPDLSDSDLDADIEPFEIEDLEDPESNGGSGFWTRSALLGNKINTRFSQLTSYLDPIPEHLRYLRIKIDVFIAKFGNPLIIKRFLYVFFVSCIIYVLVSFGFYPSNAASPNGQFSDQDLLLNFVRTHIDNKRMHESLEYLSSVPHMAGTAGDLALAKYVDSVFQDAGISPREFNEVKSWVNYPEKFELELKDSFKLDYSDKPMHERPFDFLGKEGEVSGSFVYVNYARRSDFADIKEHNNDLKGSICVARTGKIGTSTKLRIAHEQGCEAIIFFTPTLWNKTVTQKHSNVRAEIASGDILTPGWPSLSSNPKLDFDSSSVSQKIPSVTLDFETVEKILHKLKGDSMTKWDNVGDWKPKCGDKSATGRMLVKNSQRDSHTLWNVVAKITGIEQQERAVVVVAPRDSACNGAIGPNSATVAMLELVRLFSGMERKLNWKPLRTIYFLSVDGSEYNHAGITEWIEERYRELRKEAFVVVDLSNAAVTGNVPKVVAHPVFENLLQEVLLKSMNGTFTKPQVAISREYSSSYPFQAFAGVPSIELRFESDNADEMAERNSILHSCLDNFQYFTDKKIDPDMMIHSQLVESLSTLILRLLDDPLIPYSIGPFAAKVEQIINDVNKYSQSVKEGSRLDWSAFNNKVDFVLKKISKDFEIWRKTWQDIVEIENGGIEPSLLTVRRWEWNVKLSYLVRFAVSETGLPDRPWIKNLLFAPQMDEPDNSEDFEWWTFPGVRDAIMGQKWGEAQNEIDKVAVMLQDAGMEFYG